MTSDSGESGRRADPPDLVASVDAKAVGSASAGMARQTDTAAVARADFGRVSVFFGTKHGKYPDGNQVIVAGSDTRCVFDSPVVANRIGTEFDDADLVVLGHVHEDHMAGLHRLPDVPVYVHERDLLAARSWEGLRAHYGVSPECAAKMLERYRVEFFYTPRPDAIPYQDGATWELGASRVRAIHMPGHTSGHCVLLVEPEDVAFIGDIDLSGFGPYYGDATSSLAEFRRTLDVVGAIPAKVWITSHHRGVYTDRSKFLDALDAFRRRIDDREARLMRMLSGEPKTLEHLVRARLMYPPEFKEPWIDSAEARTISQHLEELLAAGRVQRLDEGSFVTA